MQFDENYILSFFSDLKIPVKGIGIWKRKDGIDILTKKVNNEYEMIGLESGDSAYIRYSGIVESVESDALRACSQKSTRDTAELFLVAGVTGFNTDSVLKALLYILSQIPGVKRKKVNESRDLIMDEERLKDNELNLIKITFEYTYDYISPCEADVECLC